MSLDEGDAHHVISLIGKQNDKCVLFSLERYYQTSWQDFMDHAHDKPDAERSAQ